MKRNPRYKPVGWRGEPHRHYLAAKGIKTKQADPLVPGLFAKMYSLAASGDVQKSVEAGEKQGFYAGKFNQMSPTSSPNRRTMRLPDGREMIAVKVGDMYHVSIRGAGGRMGDTPMRTGARKMTQEEFEEFVDEKSNGYFADKYFVRNNLKGNRESSALHRAYAKGWTKEELRENADAREQFGISLQELQPKKKQFPESPSRAEEMSFDDFGAADTTTQLPGAEFETVSDVPEADLEPVEPPMQEPVEAPAPESMVMDDMQSEPRDVIEPQAATTPGIPERSELSMQL